MLRGFKIEFRGSKIDLRSAQGGPGPPKSAQQPGKSAPREPQERPRSDQERPKSVQERTKSVQERPKSAPEGPKSRPRAPQDASDSSQDTILGLACSKKATLVSDLSRNLVKKQVWNDFQSNFGMYTQTPNLDFARPSYVFHRFFNNSRVFAESARLCGKAWKKY